MDPENKKAVVQIKLNNIPQGTEKVYIQYLISVEFYELDSGGSFDHPQFGIQINGDVSSHTHNLISDEVEVTNKLDESGSLYVSYYDLFKYSDELYYDDNNEYNFKDVGFNINEEPLLSLLKTITDVNGYITVGVLNGDEDDYPIFKWNGIKCRLIFKDESDEILEKKDYDIKNYFEITSFADLIVRDKVHNNSDESINRFGFGVGGDTKKEFYSLDIELTEDEPYSIEYTDLNNSNNTANVLIGAVTLVHNDSDSPFLKSLLTPFYNFSKPDGESPLSDFFNNYKVYMKYDENYTPSEILPKGNTNLSPDIVEDPVLELQSITSTDGSFGCFNFVSNDTQAIAFTSSSMGEELEFNISSRNKIVAKPKIIII